MKPQPEEDHRSAELVSISEIRYRRLFEASRDGILILNADTGQIIDVNPFLIELLGFSREQFTGKRVWEIGTLRDVIANKEKFLELQRAGYVRYDNLPLKTATGESIHVGFVSNVYLEGEKLLGEDRCPFASLNNFLNIIFDWRIIRQ